MPIREDNRETGKRHQRDLQVITLFFFGLSAGLSALAIVAEPIFDALMWEDAWAEWTTFFAFLLAGILGCQTLLASYRRSGDRRVLLEPGPAVLGLVTLFCLLAAGEEISWGQRLIGLRPPELFQQLNFQQELNFHNILHYLISPRLIVLLICLAYGTLLPMLNPMLGNSNRNGRPRWLAASAPHMILVPWFALTGLVYWFRPIFMSTEAAELMLGLLLLTDVYLRIRVLQGPSARLRSLATTWTGILLGLPLLLGLVVNPIVDPLLYGPDPQRVEQALEELQLLANDLSENDWINPGISRDGDLYDSRIYYAVKQQWLYFDETGNYFNKRDIQIDPGEIMRLNYFLDPWNNAYWIRMQGEQPVWLYSFGPNRRLDTILSDADGIPTPDQIAGDDVGVWLPPDGSERQP